MRQISDFVTVEWAPASDPTSTTPTWVDITSVVMEVNVEGGRSGVFDLYGPRTATIRCKNGKRSPVEAPTFAIGGFYRWRQIRIVHVSSTFELFTGYILSVLHDQTESPYFGDVTISCTDKLGVLAKAEFGETDTTVVNGIAGAVTLTEAVIAALSNADFDLGNDVFSGSTAFFQYPQAAEGDTNPTGNVLQWLQDVMEAEVGGFQIASHGGPVAIGRWRPFAIALDPQDLIFSENPGVGEFGFLCENLTFASTDTDYYNRGVAKSSLHDGTFEASNVPSGYPVETLSRTDLPFIYESWAEANAALYVDLYSQAVTYPRSLNVFVASDSAQESVVTDLVFATMVFGNRHVAVKHTPVGGTQQTYNVTVENCRYIITPDIWKVELGFASLDRWIDAYGDGSDIFELVAIDGDAAHGIDSTAIIAP